jgi:hypothetical protein
MEKDDTNTYSQGCTVYVSCQNRDGDLENFFRHENHAWPPSLDASMRTAENTSDLLVQLEPMVDYQCEHPEVDMLVLDGAALVQSQIPKSHETFRTFHESVHQIFIPDVIQRLQSCERCNIMWDICERLTVLMYRCTSHLRTVNEARFHLFSQGGRQIGMVPPTQAALMKHIQ